MHRPPSRPLPRALLLTGLAVSVACAESGAQERASEEHPFRVTTVTSGLENPWGIAFLPGGDLLVTERPGRLRLIRAAGGEPAIVLGTPEVRAAGQGGLLDVELHPNFAENRLVYLTYSKPGPDGATTALGRGRLEGAALVGFEDIFVGRAWSRAGAHFGSRIVFDRNGHVFIGIGDRGAMPEAQNTSNHQGTIIRLHDDGRVPADNPFVGRDGFLPEIYAYGIRSPQGMTLHPETGALWENEHGPRGGDEINLIQAGRNYGWPAITYGINYNGAVISEDTARAGMETPLVYYVPSIAISGLAIYSGDRFPRWRGNVFVGALAGQHLRRVVFDGTRVTHQEVILPDFGQRIRQVKQGPDGLLYFLTDEADGAVMRIEPAG
jgi:glucose/arabinose dehydrogenase